MSLPSQLARASRGIPAAIEITRGRWASAGASSRATVAMIWGLTASTRVSAARAAARLSPVVAMPKVPVSRARAAATGSQAVMRSTG
jgi:hypothetical protein